MNIIRSTFGRFPSKFKFKSLIFIFLLIFASILETLGIGMIFPLIEFLVKGDFSQNIFGVDLSNILDKFDNKAVTKFLVISVISLYLFKAIYLVYFNFWQLKFSQNLYKHLSLNLYNKYLNSPISFFSKKNSSELIRNTLMLSSNYGSWINIILRIFAEFSISIFIFTYILYVELKITLVLSFILILFIFLFYALTSKRIYNYGLKRALISP